MHVFFYRYLIVDSGLILLMIAAGSISMSRMATAAPMLMVLVAVFNMISGLLIIILERTSTIGVLKSLGADNGFIRKIFLYESAFFVGKGLLWGNVIALILCWIQWKFGVMSLDQESYFLDKVPISINLLQIIAINVGAAVAILLMLILPTAIISKISPESTIKYR